MLPPAARFQGAYTPPQPAIICNPKSQNLQGTTEQWPWCSGLESLLPKPLFLLVDPENGRIFHDVSSYRLYRGSQRKAMVCTVRFGSSHPAFGLEGRNPYLWVVAYLQDICDINRNPCFVGWTLLPHTVSVSLKKRLSFPGFLPGPLWVFFFVRSSRARPISMHTCLW